MPKVFMAVSLDTPDRPSTEPEPHSAGFNVHSPFKQPTAARLARAGLSVAYGLEIPGGTTGPIHGAAKTFPGVPVLLELTVKNVGTGAGVVLRGTKGFELLVAGKWLSVDVVDHTKDSVSVALPLTQEKGTKLRYNWYRCDGCHRQADSSHFCLIHAGTMSYDDSCPSLDSRTSA